jgi:hypothetical protein
MNSETTNIAILLWPNLWERPLLERGSVHPSAFVEKYPDLAVESVPLQAVREKRVRDSCYNHDHRFSKNRTCSQLPRWP